MRSVEEFKDIHKGERCFILGTGPSLNKINFDLIRNEVLFGCNTLFRGFEKFGISCVYYGIADGPFLSRHIEVMSVDTVLFMPGTVYNYCFNNPNRYKWRQVGKSMNPNDRDRKSLDILPKVEFRNDLVILRAARHAKGEFSKDLADGMCTGGTVIFDVSLQVTHYMGFKEVYLLGCDSDYTGSPHFDNAPPDRVLQMTAGDTALTFGAYRRAKKAYEEDGRKLVNCTPGGKLEIFERKRLEDVIGK